MFPHKLKRLVKEVPLQEVRVDHKHIVGVVRTVLFEDTQGVRQYPHHSISPNVNNRLRLAMVSP